MVNYLMTLGWAPKGEREIVPWSEIESNFRLEDVTHSPAFFDIKKLLAFNGEYIRAMPVEQFIVAVEPWLAGWRSTHPAARWNQDTFVAMAPLVQTRIALLAEAPAMIDFLFLPDPELDPAAVAKVLHAADAVAVLDATIEAFAMIRGDDWVADSIKAAFEAVAEARGVKTGKLQAPMRVSITGRTVGPPLNESLELLGREETLRRLKAGRTVAGAA